MKKNLEIDIREIFLKLLELVMGINQCNYIYDLELIRLKIINLDYKIHKLIPDIKIDILQSMSKSAYIDPRVIIYKDTLKLSNPFVLTFTIEKLPRLIRGNPNFLKHNDLQRIVNYISINHKTFLYFWNYRIRTYSNLVKALKKLESKKY